MARLPSHPRDFPLGLISFPSDLSVRIIPPLSVSMLPSVAGSACRPCDVVVVAVAAAQSWQLRSDFLAPRTGSLHGLLRGTRHAVTRDALARAISRAGRATTTSGIGHGGRLDMVICVAGGDIPAVTELPAVSQHVF